MTWLVAPSRCSSRPIGAAAGWSSRAGRAPGRRGVAEGQGLPTIAAPLDLIEFYRREGPDTWPTSAPEPATTGRIALHEAIRRRYKVSGG